MTTSSSMVVKASGKATKRRSDGATKGMRAATLATGNWQLATAHAYQFSKE